MLTWRATAAGHAHALDSETPATPGGLDPAQVTAAAKNEAVASGSGKAISTLPTPQNGGATPTPTPTPLPYSPANPSDPAAYVHVSPVLLPMVQIKSGARHCLHLHGQQLVGLLRVSR